MSNNSRKNGSKNGAISENEINISIKSVLS